MRKATILAVAMALLVAMMSSVALAKGKPAGKGKPAQKKVPTVTYVFKGTVASVTSVDELNGSVTVDVEKGNKFARSYAGQPVDFTVNESTKIVEDDVETTLSDLDVGDRALVQVRAPKSGAVSFTAKKVVAESPVAYYADADNDGYGEGDAEYYFAGEEPEGYVTEGGDNCAGLANDQTDTDGDEIGDACDPTPNG